MIRRSTCFAVGFAMILGCSSEPQTPREEAEQAQAALADAREEAAEMIAESEEDAVDIIADARNEAKQEIQEAKQEAAELVDDAERDLQQKMNQLEENVVVERQEETINEPPAAPESP